MNKNILVLAAHPDDETLGCGATISKLSEKGHNIQLLTFTDGVGARGEDGDRNSKLEACCEILGIKEYASGSFPDNAMDSVRLLDVCKFIGSNVKYFPDIIFTHHPNCLNIDHEVVYRATITHFRSQEGHNTSIYSYYVPSSTDYNPLGNFNGNVYFDVKNHKDTKLKCLMECYDEEMRERPHSRSYDNVENLMKTWGSEVGLEYAEKFQLIRQINCL
tara:strand:- start:19 stop:672 length:654 start_codon:yes stop_codon:yes gene_type:complete